MINDTEYNTLLFDLERLRNAANVHTVNKAIFYLRSCYKKAWFLTNEQDRKRLLEIHVSNCRKAIASYDTTALRHSMRRLF